ncbi:MAG: alpha-glucan phosphorylase, partial [Leptolyngbyaceae cyanobacterium bins.59]|nr:alpha-glucan phosphorylase [Leptolyngbyaceae cyanobacterium bins.59]
WQTHLFENWYNIRIEDVDISGISVPNQSQTIPTEIGVNQTIAVKVRLNLGALTPRDVQVELYQGAVSIEGEIADGVPVVMTCLEDGSQTPHIYTADVEYHNSGLQGLSLRVLPKHEFLSNPYEPRLILWAS